MGQWLIQLHDAIEILESVWCGQSARRKKPTLASKPKITHWRRWFKKIKDTRLNRKSKRSKIRMQSHS
jgi:hypothetical protein